LYQVEEDDDDEEGQFKIGSLRTRASDDPAGRIAHE
jgi:hypothetical protein